jgi:hypothetical protein
LGLRRDDGMAANGGLGWPTTAGDEADCGCMRFNAFERASLTRAHPS